MRDVAYVEDLATTIGLKVWPSFLEAVSCTARVIYLLGGWRAGKSARAAFLALLFIIDWLMTPQQRLIWLVGPDYEQARPEYHYIRIWCVALGMQVEASGAQQGSLRMMIRMPGMPGSIEVMTKSADDANSLGGLAPDLLIECEAGQISDEADMWVDGRTAEKNAIVIKVGTFENDEGKQQYVHFENQGAEALEFPTERRQAFKLPTWENEFLYGNCLEGSASIVNDPTLAVWCPEGQHGVAHSGLNHPMMRQLKDRWRDRPRDWDKRFGGEPQGLKNPVYEWAAQDKLIDITGNKYLVSLSAVERVKGKMLWLSTAGGIDPGLVHPAGLVIASTNQHRDIWFRDAQRLQSSNTAAMYDLKDHWEVKYGKKVSQTKSYLQWGGDPVGLKYTRPSDNIIAMTGSVFAREERASIVNSYAVGIDNAQHLYFDADVPGVRQLFAEAQTIHRKRKPSGEWGYNRVGDDLMAAGENAVTVLHSRVFNLSSRQQMPPRYKRQLVTPRSAS